MANVEAIKCASCGAPLPIAPGTSPEITGCEYCGTNNRIKTVLERVPPAPQPFNERLVMGTSVDDLWMEVKRAEVVQLMPASYMFRWMVFGVVGFMVAIGAYIILTGLQI